MIDGGFLTLRAFQAEAIVWEMWLVEKNVEPTVEIRSRYLVFWNLAVREIKFAFGTAENPSGHCQTLILEETAGVLMIQRTAAARRCERN